MDPSGKAPRAGRPAAKPRTTKPADEPAGRGEAGEAPNGRLPKRLGHRPAQAEERKLVAPPLTLLALFLVPLAALLLWGFFWH